MTGEYDCSDGVCRRVVGTQSSQLILKVYDVGTDFVTLEFPLSSKFERYEIQMSSPGQTEWANLSSKLKGPFMKKNSLSPGTTYLFRMRGLISELQQWGPYSQPLQTATLSAEDLKGQPRDVRVISRECMGAETLKNKMLVQWIPPQKSVSAYALEFRKMSDVNSSWSLASDKITNTQVIKKNLDQADDWVFRVKALDSEGKWGVWSHPSEPAATVLLAQPYYNLFGKSIGTLVRGSQLKPVAVEELAGKVVALYFSASWCPPCQQFTPRLVSFYNSLKAAGRNFEVVFISADRDEQSFRGYFNKMPWLAVSFSSPNRNNISAAYQVQGIPRLIVFSPSGTLLSNNAVQEHLSLETFDRWKAQA